ncbi:MAG: globin, partial [Thauera sp.]|nr:globin [Thauera sp.]
FSGSVFGTHMQLKGVEPVHFERWMSLWYRHTAAGFEATDRKQLREKAEMIGRSLFLGFFSTPAKFIADDDGRVVVERC